MFLASTKRGQSDGSAIPMGAPISGGRSFPTSTPTTGVTTPPHTTATTGITALLTIGKTAARQQAAGLTFRPLPRLAENEEPGCTRGGTGGRGGLVEMTRRKREIAGLANEQDFPYLVELALPPGGFRSVFQEIDAFHRERHIPVRRGRSRYEVEPFYIRFCFPDTATADAFRNRFGGVTRAPVKPSRGPRLRRRRRTGAQSDGVRAVQYGRR